MARQGHVRSCVTAGALAAVSLLSGSNAQGATLTEKESQELSAYGQLPSFSGLSATGLYQFNVPVPDSAADGNIPVVATIGGFSSPGTVFITVKK